MITAIRLSSQAQRDIDTIADFTFARWGETQMVIYIKGIGEALNSLVEMPMKGRDRSPALPELRSLRFQSHLIFYLIGDVEISIVRILHHSQDADTILGTKQ